MQSIVKGRNLSFSIEDKSVVITSTQDANSKPVSPDGNKTGKTEASARTNDLVFGSNNPIDVTGKVVDENGKPLPDASIAVLGALNRPEQMEMVSLHSKALMKKGLY
ncbi:hypothetical protein KUH03_30205 [Sphingobacterium sp. E70]|uniref:hypothetical protein n=1 Tax=Sphingobacterium sp. E70 TaxID=2853439 RepID=UPI00211BBEA1|nr:hypothetical protein [Sphingobacterium sp. E70]ULT23430.1 hypothetical protein KUH03_30205 [Sphingobacterium sp. E70]